MADLLNKQLHESMVARLVEFRRSLESEMNEAKERYQTEQDTLGNLICKIDNEIITLKEIGS